MDRLKIIQIFIFTMTILVVLRLFYWQFIASVSSNSVNGVADIKIPANRGEIYTKDRFPLAANQQAYLAYIQPYEVKKSPHEIAQKLAPFLISEKYSTPGASLSDEEKNQKEEEIKKKQEEIEKNISNKNLSWVQLARKIPQDIKEKIIALNIEGLGFEKDQKRFYPEGAMAASILGFVGSDKFGDDTGYFGLEGYYDGSLKGISGREGLIKDPFGFPILVGKYRPIEAKKGNSLYLTIDRTIQFIVEKKLKESVEKYGAKEGTVIVSEPATGHIIAMANYPSYDPSLYTEFDENLYKNPAVADTYEPGSTFKLITMSAALDSGVVTPDTKCDVCSGPRVISGYKISTWNDKYYPNSTMTEVIQHSDNIGMTFVADKLGIDKFYEYITKFGFGKKTGIDLQEETTGTIREKEDFKTIDLTTASFGQGIAVTPIQMVSAVSAIANKGKQISLKIVEKISDGNKETLIKSAEQRQVISAKTTAQITEMMVNAVQNGEAKAFAPKGYRIAGKTGTAQIPVAGHYDPNKTIASFIGFAPADDPRFVMLVRFTEPKSSVFGSETAAPTFFAIAREIFNYLAILPQDG